MSRALFLRHGESAHNAHTGAEPLSEQEGDRLTELGLSQARAAGAGLAAGHVVTRLLSSPMRRARETAEAVAEELELEPVLLPFAHELHAGEGFQGALSRVRELKAELQSSGED